jgi:hypothetical protein
MYEGHEGEFSYSILRQRLASDQTGWTWQVRHSASGDIVNAGTSLRSHEHAKTAAFNAIWDVERKPGPARHAW